MLATRAKDAEGAMAIQLAKMARDLARVEARLAETRKRDVDLP